MIVLDSNVWIAFLNADDRQHARAEQVMKSVIDEMVGIPEYVIVEVCNVVAAKVGQPSVRAFLKAISEHERFAVLFAGVELYSAVSSLFIEREWSGLSFVDVALVFLTQEHKLITFDRELEACIRGLRG